MARRIETGPDGVETALAPLLAARAEADAGAEEAARAILAEVRTGGDAALCACTRRLDGFDLDPAAIRVPDSELEAAERDADPAALEALALAASRVRDFHRRRVPEDLRYVDEAGVTLGERWSPLDSVGVYVPGGTASYPSSVLMNAVPAKVAGVARIAMAVPHPGGAVNPLVLAAARLAGVDEVYRVGGAQAVAAFAYGTGTVRPVDKVVGPGNAYVAAAKRLVAGTVGVDLHAGPSEILVVADAESDPDWIALDLLAQAEHDRDAQAVLVTDDAAFADAVEEALGRRLARLPRREIAAASWERHGAVVVVPRLADAPRVVNLLAPEHVELAVADPAPLAGAITAAGAVFLGRHTPEAVGDYVAGPSHVLPTSRSARFSSGLTVLDFLRRTSVIGCDAASLARVGPAASTLAGAEGLDAHRLSVDVRLGRS